MVEGVTSAVVKFPSGDNTYCHPKTLGKATWEEVAEQLLIDVLGRQDYFAKVFNRGADFEKVVISSTAEYLKSLNGEKAMPYADVARDAESVGYGAAFAYKSYLNTHCSDSWLKPADAGSLPEISYSADRLNLIVKESHEALVPKAVDIKIDTKSVTAALLSLAGAMDRIALGIVSLYDGLKAYADKASACSPAPVADDTAEQPLMEKPTAPPKPVKVDKPKVDKPKVDKPKVDKPKVDKPKVDKPKVDKPAKKPGDGMFDL